MDSCLSLRLEMQLLQHQADTILDVYQEPKVAFAKLDLGPVHASTGFVARIINAGLEIKDRLLPLCDLIRDLPVVRLKIARLIPIRIRRP